MLRQNYTFCNYFLIITEKKKKFDIAYTRSRETICMKFPNPNDLEKEGEQHTIIFCPENAKSLDWI